jgi:hypothetical protein
MLKAAISFFAGVAVCGLVLVGARTVIPALAVSEGDAATSENSTMLLADLLPDFEKIYQESLTMPFKKAESKITDPDIAAYYRDLMDATGLTPEGQ